MAGSAPATSRFSDGRPGQSRASGWRTIVGKGGSPLFPIGDRASQGAGLRTADTA